MQPSYVVGDVSSDGTPQGSQISGESFWNVLGVCSSLDVYSEYLNAELPQYTGFQLMILNSSPTRSVHGPTAWTHIVGHTHVHHIPLPNWRQQGGQMACVLGVPATAFQLTCIQACSSTQPPVCHYGCRALLTVLLCLCRARSAVSPWRTELSLNYHRAQLLRGTHCGSEPLATFWPQRAYLPPSS